MHCTAIMSFAALYHVRAHLQEEATLAATG